jgi:hypothetical protein
VKKKETFFSVKKKGTFFFQYALAFFLSVRSSSKESLQTCFIFYVSAEHQTLTLIVTMAFLQNLFGLGESKKAHEQFYGNDGYQQQHHHKSSFTHELVSGAAGFAGKIFIISISI